MKRYLQKTLQEALSIWIVLEILILVTSILYAILVVAGISKSHSLLVAFSSLVVLMLLGLLLVPKRLPSQIKDQKDQLLSNSSQESVEVSIPTDSVHPQKPQELTMELASEIKTETGYDLKSTIYQVAERIIQQDAEGILSAEELAAKMAQEWDVLRHGEEKPSQSLLTRIAWRIYSRALYEALRLPTTIDHRLQATDNLSHYLEHSLQRSSFALSLAQYTNATEDVLLKTLEDIQFAFTQNFTVDPAAFLKWAQVTLLLRASAFIQKVNRESAPSLETEPETLVEQIADQEEQVLYEESQRVLKNAILSLRNRNYQQVLLFTYLVGMDEQEVADYLKVSVQEIYMWRYRALRALSKKAEVQRLSHALHDKVYDNTLKRRSS